MARSYKRGAEFPHEGFVQHALERHFANRGYEIDSGGRVDLLCQSLANGQSWHIEVKGVTTQIGLDFRTGLGQLVQAVTAGNMMYGLAIPDTPAFRTQVARVSRRVTEALNLHWLLVSPDGGVLIVPPTGAMPALAADSDSNE
ncbi:hypothetical protein [Noviluteimonas dokdonensis]|uniref:hypothetical protein n=1 Tax=Noviluteimonas dokdonensis TaxID=414050 RepID=UPI0006895BB9|nr:hypothetical protein [Lysobacter dokdonensis]